MKISHYPLISSTTQTGNLILFSKAWADHSPCRSNQPETCLSNSPLSLNLLVGFHWICSSLFYCKWLRSNVELLLSVGNVRADNEEILLKFRAGATSPVTPVCLCLIERRRICTKQSLESKRSNWRNIKDPYINYEKRGCVERDHFYREFPANKSFVHYVLWI